jgi:hypothetical protein
MKMPSFNLEYALYFARHKFFPVHPRPLIGRSLNEFNMTRRTNFLLSGNTSLVRGFRVWFSVQFAQKIVLTWTVCNVSIPNTKIYFLYLNLHFPKVAAYKTAAKKEVTLINLQGGW